jgi:transcriptional regulator with XRE-family HTH domain
MTMKRNEEDNRLVSAQLAENVRRRRADLDIDQAELAGRAELAVSEVAALEAGDRQPLASTMKKVAEGLECDLSDLLDGVRWVLPDDQHDGHIEREGRRR